MSATRRKALLVGLLVPVLGLVPAWASAPISDPPGDTVDDETEQPLEADAADILSAQAEAVGDDIVLRYRAAKSVDPLTDKGWTSDDTYADFYIDSTGDGVEDYDAEYGVEDGALYVVVMTDDGETKACDGKAAFENGEYVATVAKSCVGNPASFSYSVETSYDGDPDNPSPIAFDAAPDDGLTAG